MDRLGAGGDRPVQRGCLVQLFSRADLVLEAEIIADAPPLKPVGLGEDQHHIVQGLARSDIFLLAPIPLDKGAIGEMHRIMRLIALLLDGCCAFAVDRHRLLLL